MLEVVKSVKNKMELMLALKEQIEKGNSRFCIEKDEGGYYKVLCSYIVINSGKYSVIYCGEKTNNASAFINEKLDFEGIYCNKCLIYNRFILINDEKKQELINNKIYDISDTIAKIKQDAYNLYNKKIMENKGLQNYVLTDNEKTDVISRARFEYALNIEDEDKIFELKFPQDKITILEWFIDKEKMENYIDKEIEKNKEYIKYLFAVKKYKEYLFSNLEELFNAEVLHIVDALKDCGGKTVNVKLSANGKTTTEKMVCESLLRSIVRNGKFGQSDFTTYSRGEEVCEELLGKRYMDFTYENIQEISYSRKTLYQNK